MLPASLPTVRNGILFSSCVSSSVQRFAAKGGPATKNSATGYNSLKSQIAQSRMIVRSASEGPVIQPFGLRDCEIVDAGMAYLHKAALVELPIFVAVTSPPLPGGIMALVGEADC